MRFVGLLGLLLLLGACSAVEPLTSPAEAPADTSAVSSAALSTASGPQVTNQFIASRDVQIPITLTAPAEASEAMPLVVMLHGHGGDKNEAGGFTQVAERLADAGVASVRMDFAGCGDSTESFRNNRLSTMLADARSARDYALDNLPIDTTRMALVGYSMGGRLAITLAEEDPRFHTLALWAPSANTGTDGLAEFFGGDEALAAAVATANAEGFTAFTTPWGDEQELGAGWFEDMAASEPSALIEDYNGSVFVLYGDKDTVVKPAEAEMVVTEAAHAYSSWSYVVEGADHGLGLFSEEPELTELAVTKTVDALVAGLRESWVPQG